MGKLVNLLFTDELRFIEGYLKIRGTDGKIMPLVLNPIQRKVYDKIVELRKAKKPIRLIILKARREGLSTLIQAVMFCQWLRSIAEGKVVHEVLVAHKQDSVGYLYNMAKRYFDLLPESIRPKLKYSSRKELVMDGLGSSIFVASAEGSGVGVAGGFSMLHLSEFARYQDAEGFMNGIMPTIPDNDPESMVVLESTAWGSGNLFHKYWLQSREKEASGTGYYTPLFFAWHDHPVYKRTLPKKGLYLSKDERVMKERYSLVDEQIYWYRRTLKDKFGGDEVAMHENFPSNPEEAFIESGRPVFHTATLNDVFTKCPEEPKDRGSLVDTGEFIEFRSDSHGDLQIWRFPEEGRRYVIGVDSAECATAKSDFCAATVLDLDSFEQVAVIHGRYPPEEYVYSIFHLGSFYNNALLAPERNSSGIIIAEELLYRLHYPNLYMSERYDGIQRIVTQKIGWEMTSITKSEMIVSTNTALRERRLKVNHRETVKQMLMYRYDERGRAGAPIGEKDDLVVSVCIACVIGKRIPVRRSPYRNKKFGTGRSYKERLERRRKNLTPMERAGVRAG